MTEDLYHTPAVQTPSISKLREIAAKLGMNEMPEQDLKDYQDDISQVLKVYDIVHQYPEPTLPVKYPRTPGYRPSREENKYNAWYYKTDIKGAPEGKLAGKKIAIKDNIPVAGVPMMNGSSLMEGYTPDFDATVVTRILDEGGCVGGKAVCESLCLSACSFSASTGPVLNPHNPAHSAGGSSCGSAVLVASGEVDMALGGDQGGSIRMPACWTGIVGHKPTYGLVPYTGIMNMEPSLDHVGPLARNVRDVALLLEVIAGHDGDLDQRQPKEIEVPKFTEHLTGDINGVKIGVLEEGFLDCQANVASIVKKAALSMTKAGAIVEDVSIPMHNDGIAIWSPICTEGAYINMVQGAGSGVGWRGFYPTSLITAADRAFKTEANDLPPTMKEVLLLGEYIRESYGVRHYAKAMNVGRLLKAKYDEAFKKYDVIILPTRKQTAPKLPTTSVTVKDFIKKSLGDIGNTASFNVTGHPALSINAGFSEGLPVGMMIVGKHFDDATVLKVAHAFEELREA